MTTRLRVGKPDGRVLEVFEHVPSRANGEIVFWHHGSPHTGSLIEPLIAAAESRGTRLVTYARPSYGGSTPAPGRTSPSAPTT